MFPRTAFISSHRHHHHPPHHHHHHHSHQCSSTPTSTTSITLCCSILMLPHILLSHGTLLLLLWISLSTAASMTASLLSSEAAAVVVGVGQQPQSQQQQQPQHLMGPVFLDEPPARTHFSNSTGAVITCLATSSLPPVKVWWVLANDAQTAVFDVPGLRLVRPNGQLVFPPFPVGQYRQDVHSTTYRCMASNSFGTIRSRDCQVRAVLHQTYKMQVYDEFVIRENMAIMRCHVPSIIREYVRVVAWLRDEQVLVTASHNPHSGRYSVLSTGELLIRNTSFADAASYKCQVRHTLTDELRTSEEAGRLIVTEPHNGVAPRIWAHTSVRCEENSVCELSCVAHSWPLSSYRWYRESDSGVFVAANLYTNVEMSKESPSTSLILKPASSELHDGQWVCVVNNSIAEEKVVIRVAVVSPLEVTLEPKQATVDAGRSSTFNCSSRGGPPVSRAPLWFHNAKPMGDILREHLHDQRIRLIEPHILHIAAVHREDVGVYQCVVQSEHEEAQASAELKLGDVAPMLLETFLDRQVVESGVGSSAISLRCAAIGTPLPQIRWYLDDQPVPNLSRYRLGDHVTNEGKVVSYVNISNIRVVDGGEYSCVATNEVGKVHYRGVVLVTGGPNLRTTFWGHHNLSVVAGVSTVVRCPVVAYPIQTISWQHNGNQLPTNHRQTIDPIVDGYGGVLRIRDVHPAQDGGDYVCSVKVLPQNGAEAIRPVRGSVQLSVHYAPKIDRHTLPTTLSAKQGDRIKLMCSVIEGDQPVEITWMRAGRVVKSSDMITVQNGEDYSLLTFKSVLISDSDLWTCQARNAYASDNSTIDIEVNVPPKWTIEPKNAQVILGRSITINCQAEGFPKPKITWRKSISGQQSSSALLSAAMSTFTNEVVLQEAGGGSGGSGSDKQLSGSSQSHDFRDILSSYRYQVFSNGSLYLQEAEVSDGGLFMCHVGNSIGTDLSKVIQVVVQQPPRVESKFASETVIKGATATLQCRATGDPVLRAEWYRDMQPLELTGGGNSATQQQRYSVKEDTARGSITSYLEIADARRQDSALFTCRVSNPFGSGESTNIQLIVQEIPEPPRDVSLAEISSRSVKVRWKPSFAGNNAIVGFILEYRAKCFDFGSDSVSRENKHKRSDSNLLLLSDELQLQQQLQLPQISWKDIYINDANAQSFLLRDLYPFCAYELQLKAKNGIGISEPSQVASFRTAEEMPGGPPLEVSVEPLSASSLKIRWRPPDRHLQFGQIKGYYIGYRLVDGSAAGQRASFGTGEGAEQLEYKKVEASSVGNSDQSAMEIAYLTNLKRHTVYSVVISAFNKAGAGPRSDEITVRTLSVQKTSTLVLEVITTDASSITLHWDVDEEEAEVVDGVKANTGFVLHISEEGTGEWTQRTLAPHLRRHVETGLKCGTKYLLYMTHQDSSSTTGEMITARTKGTVAISPSAEEFLSTNSTAVALNFNSWHNGGCPIRNYSLKYRPLHTKLWKVVGTIKYNEAGGSAGGGGGAHGDTTLSASTSFSKPFIISNLEPNREYSLAVTASSSAGLTEAVYNFSTWANGSFSSAMGGVVRLAGPPGLVHSDISSSEYSSIGVSSPFHNVTILLPVVISVLVLAAVLTTLFAFMRKQQHGVLMVHADGRRCSARSTNSQSTAGTGAGGGGQLRSASLSMRSKEDITSEMLSAAFPMSDYHSLCTGNGGGKGSSNKLVEAIGLNGIGRGGSGEHHLHGAHLSANSEALYGKTTLTLSSCQTMPYASPKRTLLCSEANSNTAQGGGEQMVSGRPSTRVTVNSHHIYAEPNPSGNGLMMQTYAQPRCLLTTAAGAGGVDNSCQLLDTSDSFSNGGLLSMALQPPGQMSTNESITTTFRALITSPNTNNSNNAHI